MAIAASFTRQPLEIWQATPWAAGLSSLQLGASNHLLSLLGSTTLPLSGKVLGFSLPAGSSYRLNHQLISNNNNLKLEH